jgi:protein arginine kinase activator
MKCENCGKNQASVHYTAYENNQPKEMHVCQDCAAEKGIVIVSSEAKFSIQDPIIAMVGELGSQDAEIGRIQCPSCGLMFSGFRETGRLGCARCYESFEVQLKPLLRRIHGSTGHLGKSPAKTSGQATVRSQLRKLQQKLETAIMCENFEKAAELRDQIRQVKSLKEETESEGKP